MPSGAVLGVPKRLPWLIKFRSQTSVPPPSGSLQTKPVFGNSTSQPQQGTSLFTGSNQQNGGMFGNLTNQTQGGGLFGSQPTSSLFGISNVQQPQPQQETGLFGSTLGQTQPSRGSGLFGAVTNNQNKSSLFGASQSGTQAQLSTMQQRAPVSIFSNSIGQQSQQQQTIPGVRISVNELRSTTRFNDLHEELQKAIEYVDAFVMNKIKWQEQCEAASGMLEDLCQQMPPDVDHCTKNLEGVQQSLENDAESISFAKSLVKSDVADAKLSFKVINNLKLPQPFHHANLWSSVSAPQQTGPTLPDEPSDDGGSRNLVDYFSKQADEMSSDLESYKRNVAEVEAYLKSVESNALQQMQHLVFTRSRDGGAKTAGDQVRELAAVLREFENGILGVATKVGGTRETVQDAMLGPTIVNEHSRFPQHGSRLGLS